MQLLTAGAIGGLIGIEREHREDGAPVIAGVRTFPLISLAGFLVAWVAQTVGSTFVIASGVLGIFGFALVFIWLRQQVGQTGITTPSVMVVTFLLGVVVAYGFTFEAVVVGVGTTFLLVTKKRLHGFARVLDDEEILSALQFLTILFILLPLTAQIPGDVMGVEWIGRGRLVDPYVILLVVVFVSAISFASLVAMRMVGTRRGIEFSGLMGGLVNSEATTASLAHRAKADRSLIPAAVVGSLLATSTMLFRNAAIAAFTERTFAFVLALLPFLLPVAAVGAFLAWRARETTAEPHEAIRVKNPFAVLPALRFALLFAAVSIAASLATTYLGEAGIYITALGGFVSAGAVIASLANLHGTGGLALTLAVRTGLLAIAASIAGKLVILRMADEETYRRARTPYGLFALAGAAAAGASFLL